MALVAYILSSSDFDYDPNNQSVDEQIEVLYDLSRNDLLNMLNELLNKNHNDSSKLKNLWKAHSILIANYDSHEKQFENMKRENQTLKENVSKT